MTEVLSALAADPGWHLFDFDLDRGSARLIRLSEAGYRAASFLDERVVQSAPAPVAASTAELAAGLDATFAGGQSLRAVPGFIFHLGHCGSTLLSRALDSCREVLPLREPLTLRRLAPVPEQLAAWQDGLLLALRAHSRAFRAGQKPVIKATSICNRLIGPMLEAAPGSRAVLMYVTLETYLAGLLGKSQPALDLRRHAPSRLADWNAMRSAPPLDVGRLDEPGLAVLAWITGMRHLVAAARTWPDRALMVEFETFLDAPQPGLQQVASWLSLEAGSADILAGWPEVSTGYSKKPDEPYSAFNRRRTLARGREKRGPEIRAGLAWAAELVRTVPELAACEPFFQ